MSRQRMLPLVAVILIAVAVLATRAGCGKAPPSPAPAPTVRPEDGVMTGTVAAMKAVHEKQTADLDKQRDEAAHGLLASFQSRTFDPRRDGRLDHAEGVVSVRAEGRDAKYRFVYDAANPPEHPVTIETLVEPAGLDAGTAVQVRQWAIMACCGAAPFVAYYTPPIPLVLTPASDPKSKNLVVFAPAFKSALNVSYNFDERQLVAFRGEWTDPNHKFVTTYDWTQWHGRWLLAKAVVVKYAPDVFPPSTTEFEYEDHEGDPLLKRAHLRDDDKSLEAVFDFDVPRRRPK